MKDEMNTELGDPESKATPPAEAPEPTPAAPPEAPQGDPKTLDPAQAAPEAPKLAPEALSGLTSLQGAKVNTDAVDSLGQETPNQVPGPRGSIETANGVKAASDNLDTKVVLGVKPAPKESTPVDHSTDNLDSAGNVAAPEDVYVPGPRGTSAKNAFPDSFRRSE